MYLLYLYIYHSRVTYFERTNSFFYAIFLAKLLFCSLFLSRSVKLVLSFFLSQFGCDFFKSDSIWSLLVFQKLC